MAVGSYEGLVALYAELGLTSTRRPPSRWQPEFGLFRIFWRLTNVGSSPSFPPIFRQESRLTAGAGHPIKLAENGSCLPQEFPPVYQSS
jgi:hypothetical protein